MNRSVLKQLIREVAGEFYKDQLFLRATGANKYAYGGMGRWFKIIRIEDEGDSFGFYVVSRGRELSVGVSKERIKQKTGNPTPNLAFKIRSMPATVMDVLHHYYQGNIPL